jgi:hypothetical protein
MIQEIDLFLEATCVQHRVLSIHDHEVAIVGVFATQTRNNVGCTDLCRYYTISTVFT